MRVAMTLDLLAQAIDTLNEIEFTDIERKKQLQDVIRLLEDLASDVEED